MPTPEERLELAVRLWEWEPHEGQRGFLTLRLDDGTEPGTLVAACGRRWGKTASLAVDAACRLLTEPDLCQLLVGPTRDQVDGLFDEILTLLEEVQANPAAVKEFPHLMRLEVKRAPYCQIRIRGVPGNPVILLARSAGRNGRNLRGKGTTRKVRKFRVVVDEAAFVPDAAIEEVILPMLATVPHGGGQLVLISSPNGRRGAFYEAYRRGEASEGKYRAVRLPSSGNPLVDAAFLDEMRERMTERRFRAEFLAEFVESAGAVFRDSEIDAAVCDEDDTPAPLPGARYVAGVDLGRRGDYTVVLVLEVSPYAVRVVDLVRVRGLAWAAQVEQAAETLERWNCERATVDRTGVGDAVAEQVQEAMLRRRLRCVLDEFVFTAASKTALVDGLSLMLSQGRLRFPPYPELLGELRAFEVLNVSVAGHERMGAATGHDDCVMALGLAIRAAGPYLSPVGVERAVAATGGNRSDRWGEKESDFSWDSLEGWSRPDAASWHRRQFGMRELAWRVLTSAYRFRAARWVAGWCCPQARPRGTGARNPIRRAG